MIFSYELSQSRNWESIALQAPKNPAYEEIPRQKPMHNSTITETEKDHIIRELEIKLSDMSRELDNKRIEMENVIEANHKFISIIAHDLRSPFNSILGYLELLKNNLKTYDKEKIEIFLDYSYGAALKTYKLLDGLLEWAASKNGKIAFVPTKLNLYDLICEEIDFTDFIARKKNIEIHHSVSNYIHVNADQQMVKSILRNLLSNAIKFTNEGGTISIFSVVKGNFIEVNVKDNGVGIAPEAIGSLFKLNAIHSTCGTSNERGNGLGLLTCKEFVEMHGGNISVESIPGHGSTFRFTLPYYID